MQNVAREESGNGSTGARRQVREIEEPPTCKLAECSAQLRKLGARSVVFGISGWVEKGWIWMPPYSWMWAGQGVNVLQCLRAKWESFGGERTRQEASRTVCTNREKQSHATTVKTDSVLSTACLSCLHNSGSVYLPLPGPNKGQRSYHQLRGEITASRFSYLSSACSVYARDWSAKALFKSLSVILGIRLKGRKHFYNIITDTLWNSLMASLGWGWVCKHCYGYYVYLKMACMLMSHTHFWVLQKVVKPKKF